MAIPRIAPYDLPRDLPRNRVDWRPDPDRSVLLVHDMQRYFAAAYAGAPLSEVVDNIGLLRKLDIPVVYSAQPGDQAPVDRGLLTDFWGPGLSGDPRDTAIVDALTPRDGETVLTKWRYSAFVRTDLASRLGGRDQLIIAGVYAHIGILATALDAFMRDIQPFVVADAVADFSADLHRDALSRAAATCAAVTTTRTLLELAR